MTKRTPLQQAAAAHQEVARKKSMSVASEAIDQLASGRLASMAAEDDYTSSTIHMPKALLRLLRNAAVARADRMGGRPSVSAVVVEILDKHRDEIEAMNQ